MVVDFRKLNSITISDRCPIPEIAEVLSRLGSNKFFSVIELKSGWYWKYRLFFVNSGKYEFTRLSFGLKNAPSIFQRTLDDILRDYIGKPCYVYIDDLIIFSKNEKCYLNHLDDIFRTLDNANMKVQFDKCEFFQKEVKFLEISVQAMA